MLQRWVIELELSIGNDTSRPTPRVLQDSISEGHGSSVTVCTSGALAGCIGSCPNGELGGSELVIESPSAVGWGTARIAFSYEVFVVWETWG